MRIDGVVGVGMGLLNQGKLNGFLTEIVVSENRALCSDRIKNGNHFLALCEKAQHAGRKRVPTEQYERIRLLEGSNGCQEARSPANRFRLCVRIHIINIVEMQNRYAVLGRVLWRIPPRIDRVLQVLVILGS